MASNEDTVKLIQAESDRILTFLNGLAPDVMELPTPCEMWTIGDMIAHLVWFAETYGGMMERGLRDDLTPTPGFPESGTLKGEETAQLYGTESINRRKDLGSNLLSVLNERYGWLNQMLMAIGPGDWEKQCYHTHWIRTVESFLPTIIQELAIHEWDIHSSLGAESVLSASSLPILVEKLPLGKPASNRRPWGTPFPTKSGLSRRLRYRFDLSGPGAVKLDLAVEGEDTRMEDPADEQADLDVVGDTSTFILIMYDRTSLGVSISNDKFTAKGNLNVVEDFDRWVSAK